MMSEKFIENGLHSSLMA